MNGKLINNSDSVQCKRRREKPKFVALIARRRQMARNKKRSHPLPAIAFVYLALVGGLLLLSASRVLAL
jgi:hypothetical protein